MKGDIRKKTGLIVKRGNEFLVGAILFSTDLRWSTSPFDAWLTRNREAAYAIARKVGGDVLLFNPIVGQIKDIRKEKDK